MNTVQFDTLSLILDKCIYRSICKLYLVGNKRLTILMSAKKLDITDADHGKTKLLPNVRSVYSDYRRYIFNDTITKFVSIGKCSLLSFPSSLTHLDVDLDQLSTSKFDLPNLVYLKLPGHSLELKSMPENLVYLNAHITIQTLPDTVTELHNATYKCDKLPPNVISYTHWSLFPPSDTLQSLTIDDGKRYGDRGWEASAAATRQMSIVNIYPNLTSLNASIYMNSSYLPSTVTNLECTNININSSHNFTSLNVYQFHGTLPISLVKLELNGNYTPLKLHKFINLKYLKMVHPAWTIPDNLIEYTIISSRYYNFINSSIKILNVLLFDNSDIKMLPYNLQSLYIYYPISIELLPKTIRFISLYVSDIDYINKLNTYMPEIILDIRKLDINFTTIGVVNQLPKNIILLHEKLNKLKSWVNQCIEVLSGASKISQPDARYIDYDKPIARIHTSRELYMPAFTTDLPHVIKPTIYSYKLPEPVQYHIDDILTTIIDFNPKDLNNTGYYAVLNKSLKFS